ncbi:MAG: siderophore ABC transporter substrate-binding protein [Neisseriaceae bacterium]|nr:siderophore ABC transporter substrate-binding protein [Neisseriaceae bacterium]MBP6862374.1 siderophore ABC transporter substrate-binding protein [Neisseriaceae bacterium]
MKQFKQLGLIAVLALALGACGETKETADSTATPTATVSIEHKLGTVEVKQNPERVVTFDFGALDTLEALGVEIIGLPKANIPAYLEKYKDDKYVDMGGLKEPNFEAIHAAKPDLIIISDRQAKLFDQLNEIAPTVYTNVDYNDYVPSLEKNVKTLAGLFGKEAQAEEALAALKADIASVNEKTNAMSEKGLILLVNDGKLSAYGSKSRFGFIHDVLGMKQADEGISVSTHGQSVAFEYIVKTNPDYIFVIDRSAVVGNSETGAKQVIENELVQKTNAFQNNHIVYLDPNTWYLSGGGLGSTKEMVEEVNAAL